MKVLMLNGSPRVNGNTAAALEEMCSVFAEEGVETELVQVGNQPVRGCSACGRCKVTGKCVFDDVVNELAGKLKEADGFVVASPVYFASANATLIAVLDRLFYIGSMPEMHSKQPQEVIGSSMMEYSVTSSTAPWVASLMASLTVV